VSRDELLNNTRWQSLSKKLLFVNLASAFRVFRSNLIEATLIKGYAAARNYPPGHYRPFGDIDLAVSADDYPKALELLKAPEVRKLGIDLHRELRHLDTLPFDQVLERSEIIDIEGTEVRIPCAEDHLRIMAVHWLNDGGQYRERLYDIYYAVQNRPAGFDWDRCLGVVSPTRRRWVNTAIGLTHKYLDLYIDDLPFAEEAKDIPEWITRCVEREWATEVRLRPLHVVWRRPRILLQQIKKRIPPNPIQATIETEGEFDAGPRIRYQIGSVAKRIWPSIKRVVPSVLHRRPTT
jgi:hypothetical protein